MPDLTPALLPAILEYRLPGLDLGGDFVYPQYAGWSLLNLPSSICGWLGIPALPAPPLATGITTCLPAPTYRRVILVLVDSLALHRLQAWITAGLAPGWASLSEQSCLAPLTSVVPSTTSSALTTFWTGRSPAEHGITGYEMWLKEYGVVANTILHSPASYQGDLGSLERAGFDPEKFLPFATLGSHLKGSGVPSYVLQHASILNSGLSRMFFKHASLLRFFTAADLWVNLRDLLENHPRERLFAYVYWHEIDTLSHFYGPDDERPAAEFASFSRAFEHLFLNHLSPAARQDTLLLLTSDHGAIHTPIDPHYELANHPQLARCLHIQPTGESRLAYLYIRPGQAEAVREYLEQAWPGQFVIVETAAAVQAGLFGTGQSHTSLLDRLGDTVVIPRRNAYIWWANKENRMLGRHGGLHREEMLIPLLAAPL
jgi:hypothetical protein